jgi:outer membrane receptor for ferric coprogen and ferric-rhodotorulic acid
MVPGHALAAAAPDSSEETIATLPGVTVEATILEQDADRTEGTMSYTPPSTSTAFKLPLTLRETPQTVVVIPQQVIKDFNLQDTRDILEFTPGVHVQSERNTEAYFFQSRGFGMQTQFDGIPAANGFGARGIASPDAAFLDRVEVLYGASGLLTGPGSPGGTVNLVHKSPTPEFASALEAGIDSFGGYRLVGDVSGPFTSGGLGGRFVAVHEEQDLYVDRASGKHNAFYGALEAPLGERTLVLLGATYEEIYDASFGAHYGNPTQPDGELFDLPRRLNLGASWAYQKDEQFGIFLRAQHEFANGWKLHSMFTHDSTDFEALEGVPGNEEIPGIRLFAQIEGWQNRSDALDLYAEGPLRMFGRNHHLMFGVNGAKRKQPQDDYQFATESIADINPATWDPRDAPDPFAVDWDSLNWGAGDNHQYGAFAAGRFKVRDNLHTILGARVSWTSSAWEGVDYNDQGGEITPYAGVVWDFSKDWSAYASYSDIFQPQDLATRDANGQVLNPIVGRNLEGGVKLELLEGKFNAALAVFRLEQTNLAEPDFDGEFPGVCGGSLDPCSKATGLVRSQGFDVSLSGTIAEGWQVIGGYSYIDQKHRTGDSAGLRYDTLTPHHQLHIAGSYTSPGDRWSISANLRYQSEVYTEGELEWALDGDGVIDDLVPYRIQQNAYTIFGVHARYRLRDNVSLHLDAENVSDKTYLNGISWPAHGQVFGDPRRISFTVRTML